VIPKLDFADQLLLKARKAYTSAWQSAVALLIKEAAVDKGEDPLGRLITEIGRAARAGWAQTARLIALLAVAAAAVALVLVTSK
jgi:hypothetical protein